MLSQTGNSQMNDVNNDSNQILSDKPKNEASVNSKCCICHFDFDQFDTQFENLKCGHIAHKMCIN